MKAATCSRCGGPTAHQDVWNDTHRYFPDCVFFLNAIRKAAIEVAAHDWGTSVSESYHNSRMAAMDNLRALVRPALPPVADQQKQLTSTVNKVTPDSIKGGGRAE